MLLVRAPSGLAALPGNPTAPGAGVVSLSSSATYPTGGTPIMRPALTPPMLSVKHMVQNQMTPSYPQFTQTAAGIEDYAQQAGAIVTQAAGQPPGPTVTDPTQQVQFKTDVTGQPQPIQPTTVVTTNGVEQQTVSVSATATDTQAQLMLEMQQRAQTDLEGDASQTSPSGSLVRVDSATGPKRLHVSNIPFRFREADLRNLLGQFGSIIDVEIIFNERGSKGFGFVTFASAAEADRAREKLNGTVVEGRKIEVNNATARMITKKKSEPGVVTQGEVINDEAVAFSMGGGALLSSEHCPSSVNSLYALQAHLATAAMRQAALRGRLRPPYQTAVAAVPQALRAPTAALATATGLPYATPAGVYAQDPFLTAAYAAERYQPFAAGFPTAAAASRYALPTVATAATYAAAATGGAVLSSYGAREAYAAAAATDPYIGHSIGPVAGYGVRTPTATLYRGAYQRFTPY